MDADFQRESARSALRYVRFVIAMGVASILTIYVGALLELTFFNIKINTATIALYCLLLGWDSHMLKRAVEGKERISPYMLYVIYLLPVTLPLTLFVGQWLYNPGEWIYPRITTGAFTGISMLVVAATGLGQSMSIGVVAGSLASIQYALLFYYAYLTAPAGIQDEYPFFTLASLLNLCTYFLALGIISGYIGATSRHMIHRLVESADARRRSEEHALRRRMELEALQRELEFARQIQLSILPGAPPSCNGLRVHGSFLPMAAVGGDFYDFVSFEPGRTGVLLADVSGHGVAAALVASMLKVSLSQWQNLMPEPGRLLETMNRELYGKFRKQFITAAAVCVDPESGRLVYAHAGHPSLLRIDRDSGAVLEARRGRGTILGMRPDIEVETFEDPLHERDRIILYTDGVTEARNRKGDIWGEERLRDFAARHRDLDADAFAARLEEGLRDWITPRADFEDDVTFVILDADLAAAAQQREAQLLTRESETIARAHPNPRGEAF